jgi:hypothetical protein
MPRENTTPQRPWKIIAAELAQEHDAKRITKLAAELTAAMDAQLGKANVNERLQETTQTKRAG